jgi:hypothetical protein
MKVFVCLNNHILLMEVAKCIATCITRQRRLARWLLRDSFSLWSSLCNNRIVFHVRGRCGGYITTVTNIRVFKGGKPVWRRGRVVRGDEKESLKSETVKYGRESQRTRTQERLRWQGPAPYTKDRPVLSSERAPHKTRP